MAKHRIQEFLKKKLTTDSIILLPGKPLKRQGRQHKQPLENKGMINNQVYVICRKELLMLQKLA